MEPNYSAIFISSFLLFLLLTTPSFTRDVFGSDEMYEIDYRGPETHSSIPPPDRSGRKHLIHRATALATPESVKKIRG